MSRGTLGKKANTPKAPAPSPGRRMFWPAAPEDDWYPCYPNHRVQVIVHPEYEGEWRIAIWGADDTAMDRAFSCAEEQEACLRAMPNPVTKAWLERAGFGPW